MNQWKLSDQEKTTLPLVTVILVLAAILRTQPHTANVTPFFAISILIGVILGRDRAMMSGLLAAAAMFIADLIIGVHAAMPFVYAGVAMAALIGALGAKAILNQQTWLRRALGGFLLSGAASTVFFVISNLGVWLVGGLYPRTVAGLATCFTMAIPFFTKSLAADLFLGTVLIFFASRILNGRAIDQQHTSAAATAFVGGNKHGR